MMRKGSLQRGAVVFVGFAFVSAWTIGCEADSAAEMQSIGVEFVTQLFRNMLAAFLF